MISDNRFVGAVQEVRNFYHKGVKGAQWKEEDIDFCFLPLRAPSVPLWSILFGQPHSRGSWLNLDFAAGLNIKIIIAS